MLILRANDYLNTIMFVV